MATCDKYQPRKCWQTGAFENAVTCCGDCAKCTIGKYANVPTFAQVAEKYPEYAKATGAVRPNTVHGNMKAMRLFFQHCTEITTADKVVALSEDVWENYVIEASTRLSDSSIQSIGDAIQAMIGKNAQKFYARTYGWESVELPKLKVSVVAKPWKSLTKEERAKIRDYQFRLYALSDPRKYLCVTAACEFSTDCERTLRKHYVAKKHIPANVVSIAKM